MSRLVDEARLDFLPANREALRVGVRQKGRGGLCVILDLVGVIVGVEARPDVARRRLLIAHLSHISFPAPTRCEPFVESFPFPVESTSSSNSAR